MEHLNQLKKSKKQFRKVSHNFYYYSAMSTDIFLTAQGPIQNLLCFIAYFVSLFHLLSLTDRAATTLLHFFNMLLPWFGNGIQLPVTPSTVRKEINFDQISEHVRAIVVCPECHKLYDIDRQDIPTTCTFVHFPHHRHAAHRKPCGHSLFKDEMKKRPRKEYAYTSVKAHLQHFFQRQGFEEAINLWRSRQTIEDTYSDIYDGRMWHAIRDPDGPYSSYVEHHRRALLLSLNVDWFSPFENSAYSCGAIYMMINNLPRTERYKKENVICVGIMPGPREASTYDINNYLEPLINELEELYATGAHIPTAASPHQLQHIRAALLMVACDMPAARKVSGFLSYMSRRACYKCDRTFVTIDGNVQHSGFEQQYPQPTMQENREAASLWLTATNAAAQEAFEKESGVRWSQLHRLPYFDLVRCTVVDPMHNLLLGTTKFMMELWVKTEALTGEHLDVIKDKAEGMIIPPNFDLIKVLNLSRKGFSYMKAAEWKSWCLVYSPFLLVGLLDTAKLQNWMDFVNACRLLFKPSLTEDELTRAHQLLLSFCTGFEEIYGAEEVTPNIHTHIHIRDTIQDFSVIYAFWLFSFERYNGLLGSIETNHKDSFELTFMKRFVELTLSTTFINSSASQNLLNVQQREFLTAVVNTPPSSTINTRLNSADAFNIAEFTLSSTQIRIATGSEALPPNTIASRLRPYDLDKSADYYAALVEYYNITYGDPDTEESVVCGYMNRQHGCQVVSPKIDKFLKLSLQGYQYQCVEGRVVRGSYIQALFTQSSNEDPSAFPGQVQFFVRHVQRINGIDRTHYFAFVRWYLIHKSNQDFEDQDVFLWKDRFEPVSFHCIIPLARIYSPIAIAKYKATTRSERCVAVIPVAKKIHA